MTNDDALRRIDGYLVDLEERLGGIDRALRERVAALEVLVERRGYEVADLESALEGSRRDVERLDSRVRDLEYRSR